MSPARDSPVEGSPEEEIFMKDLAAFHEERGTTFDPEPRLSGKRVNLYHLYHHIMSKGGYDVVSNTKLAWRTVGEHFDLGRNNIAALAFQLKTVYYKYLAAYEITKHWGETPPPKHILEDLTAKGGDLRTRTLENFSGPSSRDAGGLGQGQSDDSGDDERRTPKMDRMDVDEPGSGGGRSTRLRQAPPPRQLWQPEISTRQTRHAGNTSSPQPSLSTNNSYALNPASDPKSAHFNITSYEPKPQMPLTLRPVVTPGNNPELFRQKKQMAKSALKPKQPQQPLDYLKQMLPGSPNIYIRCLYGLRSGVAVEEEFALHHLVKVSHERGDKYKFEGFPILAEALLEKAMEVTKLFYGIEWKVSYLEDESLLQENVLDGSYGTRDLLHRIELFPIVAPADDVEDSTFQQKLHKINEAALVIRNMVLLEDNAAFISRFPVLHDFLVIALNLPTQSRIVEFQNYAIDIAEQVTKYWSMKPDDPLYRSLLALLERDDRGVILGALQAISRISMTLEENNKLSGVPISTVERLCSFVLLEDEELINSSLDFLYQYTAIADNVEPLLNKVPIAQSVIPRLTHLLLHGARTYEDRTIVRQGVKEPPATEIPTIPNDLYEQLLKYEEPDRSSRWLRCCFEEEPTSDITQIAIWQAYQSRFLHDNVLPAADFIKNVSNTFANAQAQVINGPNPRFIIKGIRPRKVPLTTSGQPHRRCQWEDPEKKGTTCGTFHTSKETLWNHIVGDHLKVPRDDDGKFKAEESPSTDKTFRCHWPDCQYVNKADFTATAREVALHVRLHLTDDQEPKAKIARLSSNGMMQEPEYSSWTWLDTPTDEKGHPAGIPLTCVLILRNLARNLPRKQEDELGAGWMEKLFGHVKTQLWYMLSVNRPMAVYVSDLMKIIAEGGA